MLRRPDSTVGLSWRMEERVVRRCSKVVRKSIARVNTVHNQKVKLALRLQHKDAKCDAVPSLS
jgi:hypothetical protein